MGMVFWLVCFAAISIVQTPLGQHCEKNECFEDDIVIHWDLNGLAHDDPTLIKAIKEKVFWPPPMPNIKLNLSQPITTKLFKGQYGHPFAIEELFKKNLSIDDETDLVGVSIILELFYS